jgi:hypothetical protein
MSETASQHCLFSAAANAACSPVCGRQPRPAKKGGTQTISYPRQMWLLILLASLCDGPAQWLMTTNSTVPVGVGPISLAAADFNDDGQLDLVCGNYSDNTFLVLTNGGGGSFGYNATLEAGSGPTTVIAADINQDAKLDLICANGEDSTVKVLMNTYRFQPPVNAPALTMTPQDRNVRVTWPSASPGWSLQESADLTGTNWLPSGYAGCPNINDGVNRKVTLPTTAGKRFFRLVHP